MSNAKSQYTAGVVILLGLTLAMPSAIPASSWQNVGGWTGCDARVVLFHPLNADTCYAGSFGCGPAGEGFHRSADRGATWIGVGPATEALALAIHPLNSQRLYRTEDYGLYRTGDGGQTWRLKMDGIDFGAGDEYMTFVTVNYAYPETLYAGKGSFFGYAMVYRSFNHAQDWHAISIPATYRYYPCAFVVHPKDPAIVYCGFGGELLVSPSGGDPGSWTTLLLEDEYTKFLDVCIDPDSPERIYVASDGPASHGGVYRSVDGGSTWQLLGADQGLTAERITALALDPADPLTIYAGARNSECLAFVSTDGGDSWIPFGDGLPAGCIVRDLAVDWEGGSTVLAATSDGVYRFDYTTDVARGSLMRRGFGLEQNFPNPFNPSTRITINLPCVSQARLAVYDCRGALVKTLLDGSAGTGPIEIEWGGTDDRGYPVASGVYFCRLVAGDLADVKKMVLMK